MEEIVERVTKSIDIHQLAEPAFPWKRAIEVATRYSVPGTILLYLLGFVTVSVSLGRVGVPPASVGHAQLLAAGAAFFTYSTSIFVAGAIISRTQKKHGFILAAGLFIASLLACAGLLLANNAHPILPPLWIGASEVLIVWGSLSRDDNKLRETVTSIVNNHLAGKPLLERSLVDLDHPWIEIGVGLIVSLGALYGFGGLVFPSLPHWLGGMPPIRAKIALDHSKLPPEILNALVPDNLKACRDWYQVFSDKDFEYLAYKDTIRPDCSIPMGSWASTPLGRDWHHVVLPRSDVLLVEDVSDDLFSGSKSKGNP